MIHRSDQFRWGLASPGIPEQTLQIIHIYGRQADEHRWEVVIMGFGEKRMARAPADDSTLAIYDTALGKVGGLICWENYMPLARYALYAWGVQIYIAATWDRDDV